MIIEVLHRNQSHFTEVLPGELQHGRAVVLDLSGGSQGWEDIDCADLAVMQRHTKMLMQRYQAVIAIGRYGENRWSLYQQHALFQQEGGLRSVHLGMDLTVPVETPVYAPLAGIVHSFNNNAGHGDYGPTIILQHQLDGTDFFTLYGHLSLESLDNLCVGQKISQAQQIATIGSAEINGGWVPHLHFQIIVAMGNHKGDFPGVIEASKAREYFQICPDPNLILQLKAI